MSERSAIRDWQEINFHPVGLRKKRERWKNLPREVREKLEDSVYRVEDLYWKISEEAKVPHMPPVLIHDVGWEHPEQGLCFARMNYARVGNQRFFVAELPAPTVYCVDDEMIRALLVHEYAHIFWHMCDLVDQIDAGTGEVVFKDSSSPDLPNEYFLRDLSTIVNPWDWFGEKDVANFMIGDDVRLEASGDLVQEKWVDQGLPMERSFVEFTLGKLYLDREIVGRIRELRASGKKRGPDIKVFVPE